jgi:uroporphyrinogen decarboxylase
VRSIIAAAGPRGHVFNLGHGIHLDTPLEGVDAAVSAVKEWTWG